MRAALLEDYKADLVVREVPVPDPGPGEVLVRVEGCGLCHSDLHLRDGEVPLLPRFPWVLGHEIAGRVEASGPGAGPAEHGASVVVFGGWGCGTCRVCLAGEEQLCDVGRWAGIGRPGGFAEYVVVPAARHLVPLGDEDPVLSAPAGGRSAHAVPRGEGGAAPAGTGHDSGGDRGRWPRAVRRAAAAPAERRPGRRHRHRRGQAPPGDRAGRARGLGAAGGPGGRGGQRGGGARRGGQRRLAAAGRRSCWAAQGVLVVVGLAGGSLPVGLLGLPPEAVVTTSHWGTRNELAEVVALAAAGDLVRNVHEVDLAAVNTAMADLRAGRVAGRVVLVP